MINRSSIPETIARLRWKAEEIIKKNGETAPVAGDMDLRQTIHELRVHQIELEMQNEELLRTQEQLDAAKTRYFDLYDLAPVGYCIVSTDGLILEANLTVVTLFGMARSALIKQPITRFIHVEDQDIYYRHRKRLFDHSESYSCELRMVRKDGTPFWARLTATAAQLSTEKSGREAQWAPVSRLVVSDISERKQAEAEKAKLEFQLQEIQKLETLGTLAGGVAHDFNNLLTTIVGNANLGSLAAAAQGEVAPYFAAIEKAAMKGGDLNRQLLAYAGKGKLADTEMDLDIVVKEITELISVSIPKNVSIQYDLADRLPFVKGDATQVFQILMNLILNGSEACVDGETCVITVRTGTEIIDEARVDAEDWALPLPPGHYVTLEVADTGHGMSPDVLARIFEPFFTTKFTGRGLGLAAVMGILGSHRGGIQVHSDEGKGSSFKIFLPVMRGPRAMVEGKVLPTWKGEGRILVVDDQEATRRSARSMAERLGFSVLEAQSSQDALAIFRLHHGELGLVILNLVMPHVDGWKILKELQKINARVPVMLSSGFGASKGTPVDGLAGHLRKPYRAAEFQRALRRVFAPEDTLLQSEAILNAEARPGLEPLRNEGSGHSL